MKPLFIVGTDTGVGKTAVAGCWARFLTQKGLRVITQKWVETGSGSKISQDIEFHLKMMGKDRDDLGDYRDLVAPYVFGFPASPHLASRLENKMVRREKIISGFRVLSSSFDHVVVEASGGVLVPFDKKHCLIDIAKSLNMAVLLVVHNRLGAINHALLSLEALKARKMKVAGMVFNNLEPCDDKILKDNPVIVEKISKVKVLGVLPKTKTHEELYARFQPVAQKIFRALR